MPAINTSSTVGVARDTHDTQEAQDMREVLVLVTGFGEWSSHSVNPSNQIVAALPPTITLPASPNPTSTLTSTSHRITVRLVVRTPLRVSYSYVHDALPTLLDDINPDIVIHLGLASGRRYYALELSSYREGYSSLDVDGKTWEGGVPGLPNPTSINTYTNTNTDLINEIKRSSPRRLTTSLKHAQIVKNWQIRCGKLPADVRSSDDVGSYLCGFSYYISLSHLRANRVLGQRILEQRGEERIPAVSNELDNDMINKDHPKSESAEAQLNHTAGAPVSVPAHQRADLRGQYPTPEVGGPVLFLHVPDCPTPADVSRGVDVTIALIEGTVTSWLETQSGT